MTDPASGKAQRDQWMIMLASLLSPAMPLAVKPGLTAIRPHLDNFALSAFTRGTACKVAEAKRYGTVPSWDVIAPILSQAVRDAVSIADANRTASNLLASPETTPHHRPDADEIARIEHMLADNGFRRPNSERPAEQTGLRDVTLAPANLQKIRAEILRKGNHR
jgi:hypothetical protein